MNSPDKYSILAFESRLESIVTRYDDIQSRKKSWSPSALKIYKARVKDVVEDYAKGANVRQAIVAGFTGSLLSYILRAMRMSPPTNDEYTGAGRMVYRPVSGNPPFRKILRAFEKAKFGYHDFGTIRDKASRKKLYDYYKGDSLTDEQKAIIRAELPTAEFMGSSSQYAPELRRAVVAFPPDRRVRGNPPMYIGHTVEYRRVNTTTLAGRKKAEKLQRGGWSMARVTPFQLLFFRKKVSKNPPMYAHHLRERKTHGLNLKQMRRLYLMVSRGNQKAITFARNVLGIPFDETPSQVKAVVKHHVLDLAERKVRRNPSTAPKKYTVYDVIYGQEGQRVIAQSRLNLPEARKLVSRLEKAGEKAFIVFHPRDRQGNILVRPSSLLKGTPAYGVLMDMYHGKIRSNPGAKFVFVTIHHNYFHWRTDDNRSGGQPFSSNSELKSLLLKLKSLLGLRKDQIEIRDERGKK